MLGCETHQRGLTTSIITFYLNTRMHFLCAESDRAIAETRRAKRNMAKIAKLACHFITHKHTRFVVL